MFKAGLILRSPDGGAGGGGLPPPTPPPAGDGNGAGGDKGQVTFTPEQQAYINDLVGKRDERRIEQELGKILQSLGVKTVDELKTAFTEANTLRESQKTELQKAQDTAKKAQDDIAAAKREKDEALAKSNEKLMRAAVLAEAMKTIDDTELNSVWMAIKADKTLFDAIKPKADSDDFDGIADAVKKVSEQHPRWLKGTPAPPPPSNINAQSGGRQKTVTTEELVTRKRSQYAGSI